MEQPVEPDGDATRLAHGDVTLAVAVEVDRPEVDLVSDRLFALGASAVAERTAVGGRVELVADLDPAGLEQLEVSGVAARVLEPDPAWTEGWRAHARVWRCGERIVLRPQWLEPVPLRPDDVEVVMEPGRAFGSGSHATTRLCLAALEGLVRPGARVLDVGCGSGVLGVAAALLGAAHVDAIDIDPEAVRVARALAELNSVGHSLTVSSTPLDQIDGPYDLVLANLLAPVIEDLAEDLRAAVQPSGRMVMSGLLVHQGARASDAVAPMRTVSATESEGWLALVVEQPAGRVAGHRRVAHG